MKTDAEKSYGYPGNALLFRKMKEVWSFKDLHNFSLALLARDSHHELREHLPQYQNGENSHRSQPTQMWREKHQRVNEKSDEDSAAPMTTIPPPKRNLNREVFPDPPGIQTEAEILESLKAVTVQYTNIDNPVERAASSRTRNSYK